MLLGETQRHSSFITHNILIGWKTKYLFKRFSPSTQNDSPSSCNRDLIDSQILYP